MEDWDPKNLRVTLFCHSEPISQFWDRPVELFFTLSWSYHLKWFWGRVFERVLCISPFLKTTTSLAYSRRAKEQLLVVGSVFNVVNINKLRQFSTHLGHLEVARTSSYFSNYWTTESRLIFLANGLSHPYWDVRYLRGSTINLGGVIKTH